MVRFQRSAAISAGNLPEAIVFAKRISAYIKDKYEVDVRIFFGSHDDLARLRPWGEALPD